jgi:L-lactate dehydrogenase complex protein LldG
MSSRDQMLARIRAGLEQNRAFLLREAARTSHTPPPHVHPAQPDLVAQFSAELRRLEGHVYHCSDDEAALDQISTLLHNKGATQVLSWNEAQVGLPGLNHLLDQQQIERLEPTTTPSTGSRWQALEPAQVGISGVDLAIAESGTLLLRGGSDRARLASLLPPYHIAVVREEQLVRGLGEALERVQATTAAPFAANSSITLISGPSRTGDIELTLTLGVHGPREVHVVLIAAVRPD